MLRCGRGEEHQAAGHQCVFCQAAPPFRLMGWRAVCRCLYRVGVRPVADCFFLTYGLSVADSVSLGLGALVTISASVMGMSWPSASAGGLAGPGARSLSLGVKLHVGHPDLAWAGEADPEEDKDAVSRYIDRGLVAHPVLGPLDGGLRTLLRRPGAPRIDHAQVQPRLLRHARRLEVAGTRIRCCSARASGRVRWRGLRAP